MMPPLNLQGLPWFVGELIYRTLANEKCSPDAVLLIADALDECAATLPCPNVYAGPITRTASQLRDRAAFFSAPGKPLGDFDGSLTP